MNPLTKMTEFFLGQPGHAGMVAFLLLVAALLFLVVTRKISWALILLSITWVLYAMWESYCAAQKYNIRVDLLFIYPGLLIASGWALLLSIWQLPWELMVGPRPRNQ